MLRRLPVVLDRQLVVGEDETPLLRMAHQQARPRDPGAVALGKEHPEQPRGQIQHHRHRSELTHQDSSAAFERVDGLDRGDLRRVERRDTDEAQREILPVDAATARGVLGAVGRLAVDALSVVGQTQSQPLLAEAWAQLAVAANTSSTTKNRQTVARMIVSFGAIIEDSPPEDMKKT